jgi:hypothetical protein
MALNNSKNVNDFVCVVAVEIMLRMKVMLVLECWSQ